MPLISLSFLDVYDPCFSALVPKMSSSFLAMAWVSLQQWLPEFTK
jgi:hypothetical protein